MSKVLKNTTQSDIELSASGLKVESTSSLLLNVDDYILIATIDSITELTPLVTSGDIVVNNGTVDLSVNDAILFLEYTERITVQSGGVDITNANTIINMGDNLTTTDNGSGKVTVKGSDEGEGTDNRMLHVKCVPGTTCPAESTMLLDQTISFIKKEIC